MQKALRHLKHDKKLAVVIKRVGKLELRHTPNAFQSLVRAIIYQQLSGKAAASILKKMLAAIPHRTFPTPEQILKAPTDTLRAAGVSKQKIMYLKDLAEKFVSGYINPKEFPEMSDEEIRKHLIAVKGIGPWTADMFLMFSLNRPDVLPTGDLGIQRGMKLLFGLRKMPSPVQMEKLARAWCPYRTYACGYLWRMQDTRTPGK